MTLVEFRRFLKTEEPAPRLEQSFSRVKAVDRVCFVSLSLFIAQEMVFGEPHGAELAPSILQAKILKFHTHLEITIKDTV